MVYDMTIMSYGHPSHIEKPYPYYLLNGCVSPLLFIKWLYKSLQKWTDDD